MTPRIPCTILMLVILAVATGTARQQPVPQRAPGTIKEGVTAVLVDVVVRDRRGQPVRDLTPADFEILEDGDPQTIASFTLVSDGGTPPPATASAPSPAAAAAPGPGGSAAPAAGGPGVTAMVFHGLSPESRRRAVQAARAYVGAKEETTTNYIGVFALDLSLGAAVPFTRNAFALREAFDRIASGSTASFNSPEQQQQRANAERQAAVAGQAAATAAAAGGPGASAAIGGAPGDAQLAQMAANIIKGFESMDRDQQGYAAVNGLFAIVRTLGRLPGRKSVILFSEGIAVSSNVHRLYLGVIDAANRANVSIYTIDAAGLRADSDQSAIRDRVNAAAKGGIDTAYSADGPGAAFTGALEGNEFNLRSDPATSLGQLAVDTGGVLFNNTNNLRPAFERIENDLRNYYLLGYTPTNPKYDGRFRAIQVKVKRQGVAIAARKGYFAVRDPGDTPVNAWEAPALGALEQKPVPNAFPVRAASLLFPERGRPGLVPVIVEFKTAPLTFQPAADNKNYTSDFTVLVRFIDSQNQAVRKLSQHYEIRGELAQIDRAKQGDVIFYRESELPPGVYSMETIVHDAPSGKASARFSTVEIPRLEDGALRMSSVVIVKRAEKVPEKDRRVDNPLLVNDVVLHPNMGDPIAKSAKEVGFYFSVYPAAGQPEPVLMIHLLQNEKLIAQVPMNGAPADRAGRMQQLGRLPIDQLAPGTYELRAIAKQGSNQLFRSALLRIVE
jgi:VWFA-related protein